MKTLISALLLASLTITAACGSKKGSAENCNDVVDHTLSIFPDEMKEKITKDRDKAIGKCEKMTVEQRQCVLDASSMEGLMKCGK